MRPLAYKDYVLVLLMATLAFNFVDRLALGVVLQDIKADLHLTDSQLGLLTGIAFALFYSVMGIPIARWADRGNRAKIISLTTALWSVAVALCGIAAGFLQLMVIRVGVAVGEAGAFAPSLSLISDYFDRSERPRAVAIHALAAPLAAVVGYLLAGWLDQLYGWRITFMLLAVPGIVLALVARLTLKDPRQGRPAAEISSGARLASRSPTLGHPNLEPHPGLADVSRTLWRNRTFRRLLMALSVLYFFTYGILQWQPAFFIRSYGLTSAQVGAAFAALYGLGGLIGTYLGGRLAARYAAGNERLQLVAIAIAMTCAGILSTAGYLATSRYVTFGLIAGSVVAQSGINGPLFATILTLVPESMRAVAIAVVMLFANLVGMGFGPLATGVLSDALHPWVAAESLRYALAILAPGYLLVGCLVWGASRSLPQDLAAASAAGEEGPGTLVDAGTMM